MSKHGPSHSNNPETMSHSRKLVFTLLSILLVLFLALGAYFAYRFFSLQKQYIDEGQAIQSMVEGYIKVNPQADQTLTAEVQAPPSTEITRDPVSNATAAPTVDPMRQVFDLAASQVQVDFPALAEVNPDVRAWIYHPSIGINYPIVRSPDNEYYLKLGFDRAYHEMGAIFFDFRHIGDFSDRNTVIYGHNFDNGQMFSNIMAYKDQAFYDEHPGYLIYTPTSIYHIDIAAGVIVSGTDARFLQVSFKDDADFQSFIDDAYGKSSFESKVDLTTADQLVTLYTCTNNALDQRYVLIGRLVKLGDY